MAEPRSDGDWASRLVNHPATIAVTDQVDKFLFSRAGKAMAESTGMYEPEGQAVGDRLSRALRSPMRLFAPIASKMLEASNMQMDGAYVSSLAMDNLINAGIIIEVGKMAAENPGLTPLEHFGRILGTILIKNFLIYYGVRLFAGEESTAPDHIPPTDTPPSA